MQDAFLYLIAIVNLLSLVHLAFFVVGANTYDSLQFRKGAIANRKQRHTHRKRREPLVSVVIPGHNEAVVIKRTIDSVRASNYQNFEIIIVDDGSTDKTASIARKHIRKVRGVSKTAAQKARMRIQISRQRMVVVSQANHGKASAMNRAIRYHVHGELVMCLDADSMLHPESIGRAVAYFRDKDVIGVAANVRVMGNDRWLSILQRFEHMIGYRAKKFYTLTGSEFIIGGVASTYRTSILKKYGGYDTDTLTEDIGLSLKLIDREGNRKKRIVYAADVVAMTEGVQTYRALMRQRYRWKMGSLQNLYKYRHLFVNKNGKKYTRALTTYRLPMALLGEFMLLLEPLILGYLIYISFTHHTLEILLGAYISITLYTLWTIWPDEHLSVAKKLRMSLLSLGIYVIFYAMNVVQVVAIIRCLWNRKTITNMEPVSSAWISPARSGQQLASY